VGIKTAFVEVWIPNSEDEEMALYEAFVSDPDTRLIAPAPDGAPSVEFRFVATGESAESGKATLTPVLSCLTKPCSGFRRPTT
jgi:hypothetical protein